MFCSKCGTLLVEGASFCTKCGASQERERETEGVSANVPTVVQGADKSKSVAMTVLSVLACAVVGYIAVAFVIPLIFGGSSGLAGTWVRSETSGDFPTSTPSQIIFTGEGNGGHGHFIDGFLGNRVDFSWNITNDRFHMSRIPGGEGIIGMTGSTIKEVNARRNQIVFRYPNGSSATFTRR